MVFLEGSGLLFPVYSLGILKELIPEACCCDWCGPKLFLELLVVFSVCVYCLLRMGMISNLG